MMQYRTIYRNVVLPLQCAVRRRSTLRWYAMAQRQQRMSPEELAVLQRQKLAALVRHCSMHVPYYRELFRERGLNCECVEDLDVLRQAQITVSKKTVRDAGDAMLSETSEKRRLFQMATGGSTGVPGFFYKSLDTTCRRQAIKYRAEEWIGKPIGTPTTLIWGRLPTRKLHVRAVRFVYWWYQNYQFFSAFDIGPEQLARYIDRMNRFGPEFIESYVTAVHQMAQFISARRIPPPPTLRGIVVGAEQLVDEQRSAIEASFGCPVYNRYGSTEFTNIASECAHRRGLHINSDHIVVEVLGEKGQPVTDELGEIVVTDLDSFDMPLLRYRIGDRGILSSERCPCGLPFPMLKSINGRMSDRLVTRSGREIHDTFLVHALMRIPSVARFQVVQKSLNLIHVNLEVEPNTPRDQTVDHVQKALLELAEYDIQIVVNFVDKIPMTTMGKTRYFISEVVAA